MNMTNDEKADKPLPLKLKTPSNLNNIFSRSRAYLNKNYFLFPGSL